MRFILNCFFQLFLVFATNKTFAQGYVMVAGGGAEVAGGWSDAPYRWVVEKTRNKKIAVISYDTGATEWIPNYFKTLGAKSAKNFIISNRNSADSQILYDSLITYNGVFIKGGDQGKYYEYYKGTKTQAALQYIFDKGGVLSGTSAGAAIISPIAYTAAVTSVDPAAALLNAYSSQITLANDFLKTFSEKYIFDTHFIERGRFGRLPAFMAYWFKSNKEVTTGIGIDDHTALCFENDEVAKVFGTGAVSFIFNLNSKNAFDTSSEMVRSETLKMVQILNGCSINLITGSVKGLSRTVKLPKPAENQINQLFFSGTDYPSDEALNHFVNSTGLKNDVISIVTGTDLTRANDIKLKLKEKNAPEINILQTQGNENDAAIASVISKTMKFIFIANDYNVFMNFIRNSSNGKLLNEKIRQPGIISFFAGDNGRYAGKTVINKYSGFGTTSYNGTLEFLPGLALLSTTSIMPNVFINSTFYENTVSGIPFSMIKDSLRFGIYITGNTFAEYNLTAAKTSYFKNLYGSFPLICLRNNNAMAGIADQGPNLNSRNIAGFESMSLKFLGIGDTLVTGSNIGVKSKTLVKTQIKVFPNPVSDVVYIRGEAIRYNFQLINPEGKKIIEKTFETNTDIPVNGRPSGIYLLKITELKTKDTISFLLQIINKR